MNPIENFFRAIRQQGGNSDILIPVQFTRAFRKLFSVVSLNLQQVIVIKTWILLLLTFPNINQIFLSWSAQKNSQIPWTSVKPMQLVMWQGTFCQVCQDKLISNTLDDNRKLLCFIKAYDTDKSAFGGFHVPSMSFLDFVTKMEDSFVATFVPS